MYQVLVANSNLEEANQLQSVLSSQFDISSINSAEQCNSSLTNCHAVLVDTNFTEFDGIDFIMDILADHYLPLLILCSPDSPSPAEEALNVGAHNFIIKTGNYLSLLPFAIKQAIKRFNAQETMSKTILELKRRIIELEGQQPAAAPEQEAEKKRCVSQTILQEINRALKTGEVNLPPYPEISQRFNEMVNKEADLEEITAVLEKDPSISSKLISVSNSIYYKGMAPVKNLKQAVSRIGISDTRNFVELIANRGLYTLNNDKYADYLESLWQHSLACAYACQELGKLFPQGVPANLFTMGLLHDIGKLLLIQILAMLESKGAYSEAIPKEQWENFLAQHHDQFGAALLKKWKLAEEYHYATSMHEKIDEVDKPSYELSIVWLADQLAKSMGFGLPYTLEEDLIESKAALQLNMSEDQLTLVRNNVEELMKIGF